MKLIIKATGHKYTSKKRNKQGGWDYTYDKKPQPKKKRNKEEILEGARARAKERVLLAEADAMFNRVKDKAKDKWIEERADAIDALEGGSVKKKQSFNSDEEQILAKDSFFRKVMNLSEDDTNRKAILDDVLKVRKERGLPLSLKPEHPKMVVDFEAVIARAEEKEHPERTPEQKLVMQFNRFFSDLYTGFSIIELGVEQWLRENTTYLDDILNSANPELAFETITGILKNGWKPRDVGNMIYLNADLNDLDKVRSTLFHMNLLYKDGGGKANKVFMANWLRNQNLDWNYFSKDDYTGKSDFEVEWGKGISAGSVLAEAYDKDVSFEQAFQNINDQYSSRIGIGEFYTPDNLKAYLNDMEYTEVLAMVATPFAEITPLTATKGINETYKALGDTGDFYCVKPRSGEHEDARTNIDTGTFAVREAGAYLIDKAFGFNMVPPTILRQDNVMGLFSMQLWEEEGDIASHVDYHSSVNETDKFKASIFDFIAFNTDRHDGNFIVNSFGDVTLIDNGLCMPYAGDDKYSYRSELHESLVRDLVGGGEYTSEYPPLQIPDTVMEHLDNVDINELGDTLLKLGIDTDSVNNMKDRFNWMVMTETLPGSDDLDMQAWSNQ